MNSCEKYENGIKFDKGVETKLDCGIVYAAVKFRGKWLAARITKNGD